MALPPKPGVPGRHEDDDTVSLRGEVRDPFAAAAHAAGRAPERDGAWAHLENLARKDGRAEDAAAVYRAVLERPYPVDVAMRVARRAIAFHDEWVADQGAMLQLLARVTEIDATAEWAFERLSLLYTVGARWDELLGLYDRALGAAPTARRPRLLTEAARIAKDCASQPERAIRYLEQLFTLRPGDTQVVGALERLLRQQRRWRELIDLWTRRLPLLSEGEAQALRASIAGAWLNHLHDPRGALEAATTLLDDPGSDEAVCGLLSRIVASPTADDDVRKRALGLLRARYDAAGRGEEVIQALVAVLPFSARADRAELHAEIVVRRIGQGKDAAARPHLAALLVLDPERWDDDVLAALLAPGGAMAVGPFAITLGESDARALVEEAASLGASQLGEPARAEALHRALIAARPDDLRAIGALAVLYENGGKRAELTDLRRHELALAGSLERRLSLRLEIARLLRDAGDARGEEAALRDNLAEARGHRPSVDALAQLLGASGRHADLAEALSQEAAALEQAGETTAAAALWGEAAAVAEAKLGDVDRVVRFLERAVALHERTTWLDALARLEAERGRHGRAVGWLDRRLARTGAGDRTPTVLRLADALLGAGQSGRAREVLERGRVEDPSSVELLAALARCLRARGDHEGLARALEAGLGALTDPAAIVAFRREAAAVRLDPLGDPEGAERVLRPAIALAPEDRGLRAALADTLRAAGRLDEAEALVVALVAEYGKRRPPERAALHFSLARILEAKGATEPAIAELELAAGMDVGHAGVQRRMGELLRRSGQLERADRAFHALLLLATRHADAGPGASTPVGLGEALFELYRVAALRGDEARAAENLESAFEAASQSEDEALRLEASIRAAGDDELYLRALAARRARATDPATRAAILGEIAGAELRLGRAEAALAARLEALAERPGDAAVRDAAAAAAIEAGVAERFDERLAALADEAAGADEAAELWLALARSREARGALDGAAEALRRAEDTGERLAEVWAAEARVAALRRDDDARLTALRQLADAGLPARDRADVLYELAALELARPADRELGLDTLAQADAIDARPAEACAALRRAADLAPGHEGIGRAWVDAARATEDPAALLDALERSATTQEALEEAVEIATRLGADARALGLLRRSVEIERAHGDDLGGALWALRRLVAKARAEGDLAEAVSVLRDAERAAPPDEARAIALEIAGLYAGPLADLAAAADAYERLWEDDPVDATVWRPLLEVTRTLGDDARLEKVLATASDAAYDLAERTALRLERARRLVALGRGDEAAAALATALDEEPDHVEASALLADVLADRGRTDELADLLQRQLDLARDRQDAEAVHALALRLGLILGARSRAAAADVYRAALAWAPESRELLRGLLASLDDDDPERGERTEQLLSLVEGDEAVRLSLTLAELRATAGDDDGAEHALALGAAKNPGDPRLGDRLRALAERRLEATASDANVPALRRAAAIFAGDLREPARAAEILAAARARAPEDGEVLRDLARVRIGLGEAEQALEDLATLPGTLPAALAAELLRLRSEARAALGRHAEAVGDLERSAALGDDAAVAALPGLVGRALVAAAHAGDTETERAMTLRLAEEAAARGEPSRARELVGAWLARFPDDVGALRAKLTADVALGDHDQAAEGYARLAAATRGADRVDAAVRFADAVAGLGRPADARGVLESVAEEPEDGPRARARLRTLYAQMGAYRELASLLVADAKRATEDAARFEALREAGRIRLERLGEAAAAVGPLEDARALRPNDQEIVVLLGDAYVGARLYEEASQVLTEAIARHGTRRTRELAVLQHRMAVLARAAGDEDTRLAWLGAALETHPQSGDVAAELAEAAMAAGDHDLALKALRVVALQKGPCPMSRAMAYLHQATLARRQGDAKKALFFARKAELEDPALVEAKALVAELGRG